MAAYTDADVQAAKQPILDNFHPPSDRFSSWHIRPEEMARAVLDAVAPAIAARAKAEALRDVADDPRVTCIKCATELNLRADHIARTDEIERTT